MSLTPINSSNSSFMNTPIMLRPVLALERLTFLELDGKVDPMLCPKCSGRMKIIAFLTDFSVVDRIIDHLKLTFVAERPPPPHVFEQVALPAAASACTQGDEFAAP